jgi:hypothetical protein
MAVSAGQHCDGFDTRRANVRSGRLKRQLPEDSPAHGVPSAGSEGAPGLACVADPIGALHHLATDVSHGRVGDGDHPA